MFTCRYILYITLLWLGKKVARGKWFGFQTESLRVISAMVMAIKFLVVSIIILKNFDCIHHTAPVSLGNKILSRELRGPELNDWIGFQ